MDYLLIQMLNGVQLGLLMFLLAAGLTLTFGIMDLVNLAHGSLYMMGAYIAWTFITWTGSFVLGALLSLPVTFLLGVVVEAVVMQRLSRDHLDQVLATFGLILFFNELVRAVWGPAAKDIAMPAFLGQTVEILPGMLYPAYRFAIIVVGSLVALLLAWLVARTRMGMLIRAGASNRRMIAALGVNIELLFTLVFGLGAVFAGLAGVMAAPIGSVKIGMGDDILILALVIIVIGGIGSIKGAFVAAMLVGQIDIFGRSYLPDLLKTFLSPTTASGAAPAISQVLVYVLMAGVLVWRPTGLFGPALMIAALATPRGLVAIVLLVLFAALPLLTQAFDQRYLLSIGTRIVIWSIAAVSLNMILGYGGLVSFGHAAFFGIGGYAVGILAASGISSGWVQWPVAIGATALWAALVGALSLRTRGVYFIMITLAFAQLVYYLGSGLEMYGGDDGLNIGRSRFDGLIELRDKAAFYWLCLALLLATLWFCSRLARSRFGFVLRGARSNEQRMTALGFPVFRYRLAALVISGAFGGLAGVLLANEGAYVSPAMMSWVKSGDLIVMVVLGGMGTLLGPLYGAIAFFVLEESLKPLMDLLHKGWGEYWQIVFGPMLVLVALYARGGIGSLLGRRHG